MITLRRANERRLDQYRKQEVRSTFSPQEQANANDDCFGALENLTENTLPPAGVSVARPSWEREIVTYIFRGALAQEDSTGPLGVIRAGEFQRRTIGRGIHHKETNASRTDWAHFFRISLPTSEVGRNRAPEQMRFAAAERRDMLCIVASPDARQGSLRIHQDALVCSSVLDPGHHLVHELLPGRCAWLHVIYGSATCQNIILGQGDGVGVTTERSLSLTAQDYTEILLIDVGEPLPKGAA
jgi:quercetin 2,3-dioxygenase